MNTAQRICIIAGLALIVLAGLNPPCWYPQWSYGPTGEMIRTGRTVRFIFLFDQTSDASIDFARLGLIWALIGVATAGAMVALPLRRRDGEG